jgi:hypothetical protein
MSPPDPAIPLTEQQSADWQKLQQDFTDAVGGTNQNPNDPAYRTRWIAAQDYSDQMFKLKVWRNCVSIAKLCGSQTRRQPVNCIGAFFKQRSHAPIRNAVTPIGAATFRQRLLKLVNKVPQPYS